MNFDGITTFNYASLDGLGGDTDIDNQISIAISVNDLFIEANYLRLDTSNDPLTGSLTMNGNISINNDVVIGTTLSVNSNTVVGGTLSVNSRIVGRELLSVSGTIYGERISVSGSLFTQTRISVSGSMFTQSSLSASGTLFASGVSVNTYYNLPAFDGNVPVRLSVNGSAFINGNISISGLTVTNMVSANTYYNLPAMNGNINGNLSVNGSGFINGSLSVSGATIIRGNISVLGTQTINSKVSLWDTFFTEGALSINNDIILNGNLSLAGLVYNTFGGVIQRTLYYPGNLTPSNYTFNGGYTDWVTVTWSPNAYPSTIIVEADASYFISGSGGDSFAVRVRDNGFDQMYKEQFFENASGGGTRSGILFPLRCIYANPNGSSRTINIQIAQTTGADTLTMTQSANQDWSFSITEISP